MINGNGLKIDLSKGCQNEKMREQAYKKKII